MSIRSKRSGFGMRCAFPPEINATRTCVVTKRSSARLTVALRKQRSHLRIVSGAPIHAPLSQEGHNPMHAPTPNCNAALFSRYAMCG
jgi:hypothetical protein